MKIKFSLLITMILMHSQFIHAGWISSGGESLIYARNPWFVRNTTSVDYCLQMDEASFSISRSDVLPLIAQAFQYWKDEFDVNRKSLQRRDPAQIATQTFQFVEKCSDTTPLIFKFGRKSLDADEVKYLTDPLKFIGVTIRKNYSLKTLQGDGVIYISADKGVDTYSNNGLLINEAWKSPTLLRYALIHELGHFFGVAHVGSGIMSEVFMTVLLNKEMAQVYESVPQLSFLNPQAVFETCQSTDNSSSFNPDFFKTSSGTGCLKFERAPNTPHQWKVFSKDRKTAAYSEIGTVQIRALDQSPYAIKPAVTLQLPSEQTVFSAADKLFGPILLGATFSETSYNGVYKPNDSLNVDVLHISLSAEKISFVATVNGFQKTVLTYSPPSFIKALMP